MEFLGGLIEPGINQSSESKFCQGSATYNNLKLYVASTLHWDMKQHEGATLSHRVRLQIPREDGESVRNAMAS
ncbi:MAG: hypothetical protein EZS28_010907 [Streblomastix strix]|uniref:Uncharacterized protein n=1 Tax=Streblomastix strix TaxID=222440 RepID=A0A5J4WF18_9EUKA|nr:MAG: hypothetical protein EZS28_010907 [Streblomastix strix]